MKTLALILLSILFGAITAWAQTAPAIRTIRIGQNLRMVMMFADRDGLHFQYFTEPRAGEGPQFLGEEIIKNGEKVVDSFKEND